MYLCTYSLYQFHSGFLANHSQSKHCRARAHTLGSDLHQRLNSWVWSEHVQPHAVTSSVALHVPSDGKGQCIQESCSCQIARCREQTCSASTFCVPCFSQLKTGHWPLAETWKAVPLQRALKHTYCKGLTTYCSSATRVAPFAPLCRTQGRTVHARKARHMACENEGMAAILPSPKKNPRRS